MEDATVISWNVAPGDHVERGDILLAVETDKGDIDVETWQAGTIAEIVTQPGERVAVGTVLATLTGASEHPGVAVEAEPLDAVRSTPAPVRGAMAPARWIPQPPPTVSPTSPTLQSGVGAPAVSPRLVYWPASGTVRGDRHDTPTATGDDPAAPPDIDPIRAAIARRVTQANREIPHYHVTHVIDLTAPRLWLDSHNVAHPPTDRIVMAGLLIHATATAAREVPDLNGHWLDGAATLADRVDVGVIVRLRSGGIVTPVIAAADTLTIGETMTRLVDITNRARNGRLRGSDLTEPSITVTNLGDQGVRAVFGIIQPPQLALVGFGRPELRPLVVDGEVDARLAVTASLSGDHRASDGVTGASFLHAIDRALQEPRTS